MLLNGLGTIWGLVFPSLITQKWWDPRRESLFGFVFKFCFHHLILTNLVTSYWNWKQVSGVFELWKLSNDGILVIFITTQGPTTETCQIQFRPFPTPTLHPTAKHNALPFTRKSNRAKSPKNISLTFLLQSVFFVLHPSPPVTPTKPMRSSNPKAATAQTNVDHCKTLTITPSTTRSSNVGGRRPWRDHPTSMGDACWCRGCKRKLLVLLVKWMELIGPGRGLGAQVRLKCMGPNFFSFLCWKHNWVLGAKQAIGDISSLLGDRKWVIEWWVMSEHFLSPKQPLKFGIYNYVLCWL